MPFLTVLLGRCCVLLCLVVLTLLVMMGCLQVMMCRGGMVRCCLMVALV